MDIYFFDLKEEKQKEILEYLGLESAEDMNWDVVPMTTVLLPEDM